MKVFLMLVFLLASTTATQAQCGMASWYGPGFNGNRTASGQIFNQNHLTAASKTIPFGTKILVENQINGKQVLVIVNDFGPHVRGRILDLSKAAAIKIGMINKGTALVCYSIIK